MFTALKPDAPLKDASDASKPPIRLLFIEDAENDVLLLLHRFRNAGYAPTYRQVASEDDMRRALQERLKERIPVGEGVSHKEQQKWEGFEEYLGNNGQVRDWCCALDRKNLGTLGGGNHFVELQRSTPVDGGAGEPEGGAKVWLMIHSGSRNLGKRIEEHYHRIAAKMCARCTGSRPISPGTIIAY